jgi:hypothetical protein
MVKNSFFHDFFVARFSCNLIISYVNDKKCHEVEEGIRQSVFVCEVPGEFPVAPAFERRLRVSGVELENCGCYIRTTCEKQRYIFLKTY